MPRFLGISYRKYRNIFHESINMDANFVHVALRPISEDQSWRVSFYSLVDGIPSEPDTCLQMYVYFELHLTYIYILLNTHFISD